MIQAAILIFGALGGGLIAWSDATAPLGFLVALAGQPLWIIETWRRRQWGMLLLSIYWTAVWARGAARTWGAL